MSVQAGILNFDGRPADQAFLEKLNAITEQYAPDGACTLIDGRLGMAYGAFHTTRESHLEHQPHRSPRGIMVTWDGRLDNRDELIPQVCRELADDKTDLAIVIAAYEKWGTGCFTKLIGDWALSIWDSHEEALLLARDYVGIRHLYYYVQGDSVAWCTHLHALVLLAGRQLTLNDEYVADLLLFEPEAHLTPYKEIHAVPPGKFARIRCGEATIRSYWAFDAERQICYKTDTEYEEHLRHVFRQAVRHRLRSDSPILAELSGGLDSSSIVCMADDIIKGGEAEVPRLDTTSSYDIEEPGGDERVYFSIVEEKRGRTGFHKDVSKLPKLVPLQFHQFVAIPGSLGNAPPSQSNGSSTDLQESNYRIVLSGAGGDEFMGGVPDPCPQLADLVTRLRVRDFSKQLMAWSLEKRRPWLHLLYQSLVLVLPFPLRTRLKRYMKVAPWFDVRFIRRYRNTIRQIARLDGRGLRLATQRDHAQTLRQLVRQLACVPASLLGCQELRYPYLDRRLIEFITAIPAEQLLRPGQRRSLMRRAFANLLPPEILSRTTKAVTARRHMVFLELQWQQIEDLFRSPLISQLGYVNPIAFRNALRAAKNGTASHLVLLLKAIGLEVWLQDLMRRDVIRVEASNRFSLGDKLDTKRNIGWTHDSV